jgi:hypothetical protein
MTRDMMQRDMMQRDMMQRDMMQRDMAGRFSPSHQPPATSHALEETGCS